MARGKEKESTLTSKKMAQALVPMDEQPSPSLPRRTGHQRPYRGKRSGTAERGIVKSITLFFQNINN